MNKPSRPQTIIYTDGSSLGNPGPGGWAYIALNDRGQEVARKAAAASDVTNNQMELTAVVEALSSGFPSPILIYSDSKYVVDGASKWMSGWVKKGWRSSTGAEVKNKALWMAILDIVRAENVRFEWVRAHNGNHFNELVDQLARRKAEELEEELCSED